MSAQPAPVTASSELPASVRVVNPECASGPFDVAAWLELLRIELGSDGVERVDVGPAAPEGEVALAVLTLSLSRCAADAESVEVSLDDVLTRKGVRREIELGDVPRDARPRALALAVAELLRASWAELALPDVPPSPTPVPPSVRRAITVRLTSALPPRVEGPPRRRLPRVPLAPVASGPPRGLLLSLGGGVRAWPGNHSALAGGRLAGTFSLPGTGPLRVRVDSGVHLGRGYDRLGEISLGLASLGLSALVAAGGEALVVEAGLRGELGWAWGEGVPFDPAVPGGSGGGVVAFAGLVGAVRARVSGRFWLWGEFEAGLTLRGADLVVPGGSAGGFQGPLVGLSAGVGFAP